MSEIKLSLKVAIPLLLSRVMIAFSGFFASIMLSDLGHEHLAAHAVSWSIYLIAVVFFMGIFFSMSTLISQSFGADDKLAEAR